MSIRNSSSGPNRCYDHIDKFCSAIELMALTDKTQMLKTELIQAYNRIKDNFKENPHICTTCLQECKKKHNCSVCKDYKLNRELINHIWIWLDDKQYGRS